MYRPAFTEYVTYPLLVAAAAGAALGLARSGERRRTVLLLTWIAAPFAIAVLFTSFPFPVTSSICYRRRLPSWPTRSSRGPP